MKSIVYPFTISLLLVIVLFIAYDSLEVQFTTLLLNLEQYQWRYAVVSFLILTADILLPVPSSIVMYMNGYVLGIVAGASVSFTALLIGSLIGYYLGQFTSMGLKAKKEERANAFLQKYGAMAILITRGIPVLSESICVVCGYNKMPLKQYVLMNVIGYLPLCVLYASFGNAGYDSHNFILSFGLSLLVSAAFWYFGKNYFLKSAHSNVNHA